MDKRCTPHSPLTTRLSGSAWETENRIRNIFQWKKKRPPVLVLVLAAVIIALCGSLVSCQKQPSVPSIIMETQYYDNLGTYIEIPALSLPTGEQNESVDTINAALDELREKYRLSLSGTEYGSQCLFYPSTTDRYLNLVFSKRLPTMATTATSTPGSTTRRRASRSRWRMPSPWPGQTRKPCLPT